jgi:hypothetical protein
MKYCITAWAAIRWIVICLAPNVYTPNDLIIRR